MSTKSLTRNLADITVAMDSWTEPFWSAAAQKRLVVPRCKDCGYVRWPPGPFCPSCQGQATEWVSPGTGRLYSFTIIFAERTRTECIVPVLIRFADAGGVILLSTLIDASLDAIAIDHEVVVDWVATANTNAPVFRLVD